MLLALTQPTTQNRKREKNRASDARRLPIRVYEYNEKCTRSKNLYESQAVMT